MVLEKLWSFPAKKSAHGPVKITYLHGFYFHDSNWEKKSSQFCVSWHVMTQMQVHLPFTNKQCDKRIQCFVRFYSKHIFLSQRNLDRRVSEAFNTWLLKVIQHREAVVFPFPNDSMKMSPAARQIYYMMWFNVMFRMPGAEQRGPLVPRREHCSSVASQVSNAVSPRRCLSWPKAKEKKAPLSFPRRAETFFTTPKLHCW